VAKKQKLNNDVHFENVTGKIEYNLTNDYIFKAVFQESSTALTGLVSSIIMMPPEKIMVEVSNPIVLGKSITSKDFYLDLLVIVNGKDRLNLEMQITDYGDWPERSFSYSIRAFDDLKVGEEYRNTKALHHVSFITFDLFKEQNVFFDTYMVSSINNSQVYTDKFKLSVINLKHIDKATEKDKKYNLDRWCRLINASTWEEAKDIAKGDSNMEATVEKEFDLLSDFGIREEARRRREYYVHINKLNNEVEKYKSLTEEMNQEISAKDQEISRLQAELLKYKENNQ